MRQPNQRLLLAGAYVLKELRLCARRRTGYARGPGAPAGESPAAETQVVRQTPTKRATSK
jgi:hypothetical protein